MTEEISPKRKYSASSRVISCRHEESQSVWEHVTFHKCRNILDTWVEAILKSC